MRGAVRRRARIVDQQSKTLLAARPLSIGMRRCSAATSMSPDLLATLGEMLTLFSIQIGTGMDEFPYFLGTVLITVLVVVDR